jgi:DNA-binding PadR family transcriptional regulator
MDLAEILKKTKAKSERVTTVRKPPSIATDDRPYSIADSQIEKKNLSKDDVLHTNILRESEIKLTTNRQQTDNKSATNQQQSSNKPTTNSQQSVCKTELKNINRQQTGNQTDNTTGNKLTTNWQQTDSKTAVKTAFSELVGLQRDIIILVCHECKNSRSRTTEALTLEYMSIALKRSTGAIKTTIQRLEKKGCIFRVAFKNGRGGWSKYELTDNVYHDVLRSEAASKLTTKWQQTENKVASQPTTEPATSTSSSSSTLNIKETTTTQLNDEWSFDITPYAKFGFMTSQLKQLASLGVISAMEVEQSLIEFNYDLTYNMLPAIKTGKINFLMGLLRSGHSYVSEGFKNEQEAMITEMANRAESKRKKLLEDKFVAWEDNLGDEERKEIEDKIPLNLRVLFRVHGLSNLEVKNWLFNYYLQTCSE